MRCHCVDNDSEFLLCVEEVESPELAEAIQHMAWRQDGERFVLPYPQTAVADQRERELVTANFARLGPAMFEASLSGIDWERPIDMLARALAGEKIEWYLVGSAGDALRGVAVQPFDIDIVVHTRDYQKAREVCFGEFADAVVQPFTDTPGLFALRCFGRLFLAGAMVEVAADEAWNRESREPPYEQVAWNGHDLLLESLQLRQRIEMARGRQDRIRAFGQFMGK